MIFPLARTGPVHMLNRRMRAYRANYRTTSHDPLSTRALRERALHKAG